MKVDKSPKSMDFMMNVCANMETAQSGNRWLNYLIIYLSQLLYKTKYFAYMGVLVHRLIHLIK
jgi:hypothetical protein